MSRFKILVLSTFLSLPVAALLWSDSQYLANAHDGHSKGHDHKGHDHKGHAKVTITKVTITKVTITKVTMP